VFSGISSFGLLAGFGAEGEPGEGFDQQPVNTPNGLILRVGGYKSSLTENPCSGVLITLVFRVIGEVKDPNWISIIATYDDLQNASIIDGAPRADLPGTERPAGKSSPEKKSAGKRYDF
jgi:hypothetical protein